MSWLESMKTAGALALSTVQVLARLLYVLSTPLRWPLYYIYVSLIFLLSPIWAMFSLGLGAASFALNLIARLKYLYIYFACAAIIGACAGFVLHGTSSFIFVLLGIDTASERQRLRDQQHQRSLHTYQLPLDKKEKKEYDEESISSASWRRFNRRQTATEIDPNDLFEKQWKLLRTPEQPRRRRKGLLGQTIHEESSESDFL
ncbi:hypothetical protein E0Z10_g2328 [Xylaria hypoxylon]|uniref:Uncharacterized protein n=1 Tax=Xylaria hypoxylon TaxID=37992 RepID=A0A4Z0YRE6_9PEZI|nr:hypothetical protein E0Z10_g2328 [Xylaria hypoxylon]